MKLRFKKYFSLFIVHFSLYTVNAQVWDSLGSGLNTGANGLEMLIYKDTLYITGGTTAGELDAGGLAKWDGTQWDTLEHYQYTTIAGNPLAIFRDSLVMGVRLDYKSTAGYLSDIAISDGIIVKPLCSNCKGSSIYTMVEYKDELYVGGNFVDMGGVSVKRIARWDGMTWRDVGGGVTSGAMPQVSAMTIYNGELIAAGSISKMGSVDALNIARWDGSQWQPLGGGVGPSGTAASITVDTINNFLYVGGGYAEAEGIDVGGIAMWDGERWDSVGNPITGAFGMTMYKNQLYAGGSGGPTFTAADTVMARWDGKKWYPVHGLNGGIMSLATYKDELYVGGGFTKIYNEDIGGIARYKDTTTIKNCNYLQPRIFISYNTTDSSLVQFKNNNKYATNWEWDFDDGNQAFVQNPEHQYTEVGTYNVTVAVTHDGCTASYSRQVVVDSVAEVNSVITNKSVNMTIYPNPTTGQLTVISDEVIELLEIVDVNGKVVYKSKFLTLNSELDISHLSKGIYYIKATHSNGTVSQQKLMKE